MTNTSKINFPEFRKNEFTRLFADVEEAFSRFGIDFYLIGAIARDIWFSKGDKQARGTKDVDFAILITDEYQFEAIKEHLITNKSFLAVPGNAFALYTPSGFQIDILPFGHLEVEDGISVSGAGLTNIKINGFKEVYEKGTSKEEITEGKVFKVDTLEAIVLLKLIAYDDRPEQRVKDPEDICTILNHYFDLNDGDIFDNHFDLLEHIEEGREKVAARVIGRKLKPILEENINLRNRVNLILEKAIKEESKFAFIASKKCGFSIEYTINCLREMKLGILD